MMSDKYIDKNAINIYDTNAYKFNEKCYVKLILNKINMSS